MKIYKIARIDWADYDENQAHVIVANSDAEAIQLAKNAKKFGEPTNSWDSATVECVGQYSGPEKQPFILLSDNKGA